MEISNLTIRALTRAEDFSQLMKLQWLIYDDDPAMLRLYTLIDISRNGGQVLAAFDGELLIGFLVAFIGLDSNDPHRLAMTNLKLVLERIGVHPDYRNSGVATKMAIHLRELANKQGIRLVTYAFNPQDSRAAYLWVGKLGAIAKVYFPDYYGVLNDDGDMLGSSDRMIAEWWVTHNRVDERLFGKRVRLELPQYLEAETPIINPTVIEGDYLAPTDALIEVPDKQMLLLEVPPDADVIQRDKPSLLLRWKQHLRDGLAVLTRGNYVVTDFLYTHYEGRERAFYLLSYNGPQTTIRF